MAKTRYYRNTLGLLAEVIVSADVALSADANYAAFVADDANEGAIGIFNATTNALQTAALAEGDRYFIAQKKDAGTAKTSILTYRKASIKKIAYTAPVKQVSTVTFNSAYVPARFDELVVSVIETTPGNQPFPRWSYSVQANLAESRAALLARLVVIINDPNGLNNSDQGAVVAATLTGDVLTLTALFQGSSFRIALQEKAFDYASAVVTTSFKQGSGYPDHVKELELHGNISDGNTTQYPNQNATNEEFGTPTKFAAPNATYDLYQIDTIREEASPTPVEQHKYYHHAIIAIPVGTTKSTALGTALGFV
jgi:hypothetical protein